MSKWILRYGQTDQETQLMVADGVSLFSAEDLTQAQEKADLRLQRWRSYPYSGLEKEEWNVVGNIGSQRYKKETSDRYFSKKPKGWKGHKGPYEYFARLEEGTKI